MLSGDRVLSRQVEYRVAEKNHGDKARFRKFLTYEGPDEATLTLLSKYERQWAEDPDTFWSSPSSNGPILYPDAQATIFGMYLGAERDNA